MFSMTCVKSINEYENTWIVLWVKYVFGPYKIATF